MTGLRCCHLTFERVNSSQKKLTLSQTQKHTLEYLAVCFGGCVALINLFNRNIHKIIVILKKLFYLHFVTYPLGNNMLHSLINTNL